ncbi:MAG TPA: hypothetical protein VIV40_44080 [Kofleriaceae bacterium]
MLMLLVVLVARAHAGTYDDERDDRADDRAGTFGEVGVDVGSLGDGASGDGSRADGSRGGPRTSTAGRMFVPITNALIERVAMFAPPIASVVAAAYRAAGLADDPTTGWRRRSRLSALIPVVSVRAGQNQAWRDVEDPTISHGVGLDVRLSWHVDELLFDPNETRIAMIDVARRRERRRVAMHAIDLYFEWISARAAADGDLRAELDAQQREAELDAVTAGWFSQTLAKRAQSR